MKLISKIAISIIVLFASCDKVENYNIQNLNHNQVMVLGHRGMGSHFQFPGNTLESIIPALEIGTDGCEVDIQMTLDSVLVLFHNETLNPRTTCTGSIDNKKWEEIEQCLYSGFHGNIPVLSLDELFSVEHCNDYYFSLDCKLSPDLQYDYNYRKKFLMAIKQTCEKHAMSEKVFIEGDLGFLTLAKELGLKAKGVLIGGTVDQAAENNIFGIGATMETSSDTIDYAHSRGIYVMMWGAKTDIGNKQALRLNPDILQTDKPIPLLMLLNRMNYEATNP